jgi:hypothetical protein
MGGRTVRYVVFGLALVGACIFADIGPAPLPIDNLLGEEDGGMDATPGMDAAPDMDASPGMDAGGGADAGSDAG